METTLPFVPDHVYSRRADIHAVFGGNWQNGISVSAQYPYIFIFSGASGKTHGYEDGWDNPNVFAYTGEGQEGDMSFIRGNLALREHLNNGRRVFLFEAVGKGLVKFVCELSFFDVDFFETPDTKGKLRKGIKFFFRRIGIQLPMASELSAVHHTTLDPEVAYQLNTPAETERQGLVTSRVGQGLYRKRVIHRWEYQCAVTGFDKLNLLIASHIVPWKESTNEERVDPANGILLSPVYDALFDRHFISFDPSGKIILSDKIESAAYARIGVSGSEKLRSTEISTDLKGMVSTLERQEEYLNRHRVELV